MAKSAVARLGGVKRGMIERRKRTGAISDAISSIGTIATFAAGQAKRAETAWGEYETGYKLRGGDVADIPKRGGFWKQAGQTLMPGGDKGFFQMPEGEVRIGGSMYDRSKLQEAGAFLGSEKAKLLSQKTRDEYMERTAPGTLATGENLGAYLQEQGEASLGSRSVKRKFPKSLAKGMGFDTVEEYKQWSSERDKFDSSNIPLTDPGDPDYAKIQSGVAQYEKIAADRLKMETELSDWEAHDVAKENLGIDIRRDEQAQFLQDYRTGYEEQQKTAWGDYMANPPALSPTQQKSATALNKFRYTDEQRQPYLENTQKSAYMTSFLSRNKHDLEDEYGTKLGGTFGTGSLSKGY